MHHSTKEHHGFFFSKFLLLGLEFILVNSIL